jgi:hypothetical protein
MSDSSNYFLKSENWLAENKLNENKSISEIRLVLRNYWSSLFFLLGNKKISVKSLFDDNLDSN